MEGYWWKYRDRVDPVTLLEVYAEDYGAGNPATFNATVGGQITKTGSPVYGLRPTELGTRGIIDINNTGQFFTIDNALNNEKQNYAIFTVTRQIGSTGTGLVIDFRDGANFKLILASFFTGNTTNGWYYGQSGSLSDFSVIAGEDQANFTIRCWLFEDNNARLYLGGGTADKSSGNWEDTDLKNTSKIGTTSSVSLDIEIAHVGIHALPLGKSFQANYLNTIGEALETYYAGGVSPEAVWSSITV
jgi:hypothetical protein